MTEIPIQKDFEIRCNAFVAEVELNVEPKYPNLFFWVGNATKTTPGLIMEVNFLGNPLYPQKIIGSDKIFQSHLESGIFNKGDVFIQGSGKKDVQDITQAVNEIGVIADKYGGIKDDSENEDIQSLNDLKDPLLPSAYLSYIFK